MTTAPIGDSYYEHHNSPPVSPKSLPHGTKRRASDDEVEVQNQFSNTFKRLRLKDGQKISPQHFAPSGVSFRDASAISDSPLSFPTPVSAPIGPPVQYLTNLDEDYMTVDETADRVFVRDLDSEIAEIEAEEARVSQGIELSQAAEEYSKIPDHVLNRNKVRHEPEMQLILYRDPISITVSEENDAVRRAVIAARQRMRDKQAAEQKNVAIESQPRIEETEDRMEID